MCMLVIHGKLPTALREAWHAHGATNSWSLTYSTSRTHLSWLSRRFRPCTYQQRHLRSGLMNHRNDISCTRHSALPPRSHTLFRGELSRLRNAAADRRRSPPAGPVRAEGRPVPQRGPRTPPHGAGLARAAPPRRGRPAVPPARQLLRLRAAAPRLSSAAAGRPLLRRGRPQACSGAAALLLPPPAAAGWYRPGADLSTLLATGADRAGPACLHSVAFVRPESAMAADRTEPILQLWQ